MLNWSLVPIALFYLLCAIIGVIGNAIMVIVFIKEPKFNNTCNYLITLNCLADLFHVAGHVVFNFQMFTETTCSQATCFYILSLTAIGYCMSGPLLLGIGIDRFLSCKFPLTYRAFFDDSTLYLFAQLTFPITFTVGLMLYAFNLRDFDSQIMCTAPMAMPREVFQFFTFSSNFINIGIVVIYVATYMVLRKFSARGATKMRQVFKSIAITVVFVLLGWSTTAIANTFIFLYVKNMETANLLSIHAGFGVNFACSINVFVFYKINTEYRLSIRAMLGMKADVQPIVSSVEHRGSIAISNDNNTRYI